MTAGTIIVAMFVACGVLTVVIGALAALLRYKPRSASQGVRMERRALGMFTLQLSRSLLPSQNDNRMGYTRLSEQVCRC